MEKYQTDQSFQKQYEKYVKQVTPTHNLALQMLHAFVTGGAICTVGQIILNVAKSNGLDDAAAGSVCAILLVLALLPHTGLTEAHLLSALHGVIPSVFEPALEWVIRDLGSNSSLTLIPVSAIMAIWSSSRGVYCIKTGLNAIYGERESRGYVYTRLVSVLYTVLLLAALLLTLVLHVFGSQLTAWIAGKHVPILRLLSRVLRFRGLVLFALLTLLFWAILCVFPNRRIPLLRALPGAAGASLGWLVFSSLFSVYVQHFGSYSVFYGSLAGIAMAMLWLYVCMSILFYGGVLNCLLFERRSQQGK